MIGLTRNINCSLCSIRIHSVVCGFIDIFVSPDAPANASGIERDGITSDDAINYSRVLAAECVSMPIESFPFYDSTAAQSRMKVLIDVLTFAEYSISAY